MYLGGYGGTVSFGTGVSILLSFVLNYRENFGQREGPHMLFVKRSVTNGMCGHMGTPVFCLSPRFLF
jgi:putative flippase GtrA